MKQHITKKQWDELDDKQKFEFWKGLSEPVGVGVIYNVTIGQIIEFLGDDWWKDVMVLTGGSFQHYRLNYNLADALWEAVKEKLK